MWRRVSCEQPLNTSQSILRLRGNLNQACGVLFIEKPQTCRKGIWSLFQNLAVEPFRISLDTVVVTRHDWETPTEALGRVVFSA